MSACPPCRAESLPLRIVSLAPSLTRQVHDLHEDARIVGVTSYCPRYAQRAAVIGNLTAVNFEKICSLKPDLVLAGTDCNKKNDIEKLRSLGLKVEVFSGCESFACMCSTFVRLGKLLGREKEAAEITADVRVKIESLSSRIQGRKAPKVFWQVGANPLVTASDQTFTGELIRLAGGRNIFGNLKVTYPRINMESVVTGNPEVIIMVGDMMEGMRDPRSQWASFRQISAVKTGRMHVMSADLVCQPTPVMFFKACEAVAAKLYPGAL